MTSESGTPVISGVREAVSVNAAVMLCLGVVTGASITFFGEEAATVPLVGSVSGWILGAAGLLVAAGVYYWTGGSSCDCAGDCGDSCSV